MPKPSNKEELQTTSEKNYLRLLELIDSFPEEKQKSTFPEGSLNRSIRDVLAHLHHWHLMQLNWYELGMKGEQVEMPAKGYKWKDTPQLNQKIWEDYCHTPLEEVRPLFEKSHAKVHALILKHSNEELFTKKKYKWTGSTSLGAYLISNTCSHYDWAYKFIKKKLQ